MSISDPILSKKKKKREKGGERERGERENIPRVKALIITLNPAEKKISVLAFFTLLCACFTHCCYGIYKLYLLSKRSQTSVIYSLSLSPDGGVPAMKYVIFCAITCESADLKSMHNYTIKTI